MIPWLYRLTFWGSSGSAMGTPESNHQVMIGVRYVAIGASLLILLFVLPTIFFCRERVESQAHAKSRLIPAFAATITNYPFLLLIGMTFFLSLGISICSPINLYVNIYYICQGDRKFGSELAGIVGNGVGSPHGSRFDFCHSMDCGAGREETGNHWRNAARNYWIRLDLAFVHSQASVLAGHSIDALGTRFYLRLCPVADRLWPIFAISMS